MNRVGRTGLKSGVSVGGDGGDGGDEGGAALPS